MKHIIFMFIVLFGIMSIVGCRTSKSVQKENSTIEDRRQLSDITTSSSLFDSIYNTFVVSVDSIVMRCSVNDTVMPPNSSNNHLSNTKIYGIRLNVRRGQETIQSTVKMNRNKEYEHISQSRHHAKELSKSQISWLGALAGVSVLVLIVVFSKKVISSIG